jgi:hypothetical protein
MPSWNRGHTKCLSAEHYFSHCKSIEGSCGFQQSCENWSVLRGARRKGRLMRGCGLKAAKQNRDTRDIIRES